MQKLLPIGISDYKTIKEGNYYYVDKTLLIKEIKQSGLVILTTRPRRFGKTLNLSMLRYFFSISQISYAPLFTDTAIWQLPEFQAFQGSFPVIFISLREIVQPTFEDMIAKFGYIIAREFDRNMHLLAGDILQPHEKDRFNRIRTEQATKVDLGSSLEFLARMLNKYHQKKVIVLIDEYDVPVQTAFIYNFYNDIIPFLKELLTGPLKDQDILEKGVVTGNLALAQAGIFTGLNNLDIFNLTRQQMADKFGFTLNEVKEILKYYGFEDKLQSIQDWYNGYTFGTSPGIFNPWSVLKCIANNGYIDTYWANTSDNIVLKMLIGNASESIKSDLELILQHKSVNQPIVESIIFPQLKTKDSLVWSLLLFSGYLTYTHSSMKGTKREWSLIIPNQEIKELLTGLITDIFTQSVMGGNVKKLLEAILKGNVEIFAELLESFVINSMSSFDIPSNEAERSYHLFVLGILVNLSDNYEVKSNRESGLGRYDIMIIPKDRNKMAVIIEFKKVGPQSNQTLESAAQKALDQIIQKNYIQELKAKDIGNIIAYGIAFEKKELFINCMRFEHGKKVSCQPS